MNRRVVEETTRLERLEDRGERVAHGRPDVATILEGVFKKMEERSALCNLASYVNVNGDEAVNRRVVDNNNNNNNKLYLHDYKYIQYCKSVKLN